jgi:hypothetical protein
MQGWISQADGDEVATAGRHDDARAVGSTQAFLYQ